MWSGFAGNKLKFGMDGWFKFQMSHEKRLNDEFPYFNSRPMKDAEKTKAMGADPSKYQYVVQETKKNVNHTITVKPGKIK